MAVEVPTNEGTSLQATLLVSILLRFPEIGSVRFKASEGLIVFTFMLKEVDAAARLRLFGRTLRSHLDAFARLNAQDIGLMALDTATYGSFSIAELTREVATFSREELSLIISLVRNHFGEALMVEADAAPRMDDAFIDEELIDDILQDVRAGGAGSELVGFRDAGRVLVFSKSSQKVRD